MGQASGHQEIVPQSSEVLKPPSSVGRGAGERSSLAQGGKRICMLQ